MGYKMYQGYKETAAFGRLCVETFLVKNSYAEWKAAAFGRLCVETKNRRQQGRGFRSAAFGRLCVETTLVCVVRAVVLQPPSGGCVLKHFFGFLV